MTNLQPHTERVHIALGIGDIGADQLIEFTVCVLHGLAGKLHGRHLLD